MSDVKKANALRDESFRASFIASSFTHLLALAIAVFALALLQPSIAWSQSGSAPPTASLIVKLVDGLSADEQAAVVARNGGTEKSQVFALRLHVIEIPTDQLEARLNSYRADPQVVRAEVNKARKSEAVPSDPLYSQQWSLPKIGWDLVFGNASPSASVVVAILDTGIDATHPDLAGGVVPGTSILDGSNGMSDPSGHGTRVAGIVAARTNTTTPEGIAGIAYTGVQLMPVTVLDAQGLGQDSDVIAGVIWAADHDADVILMAFSNPDYSESLQEAIDYAWLKDAILVAAVGNEGVNAPSFPAGDRGVIGVSATDSDDKFASFSNSGAAAFLAAPGTNILTTDLAGTYSSMSGTSSSAAIVAGAAAQLWAFDPTLTNGIIVGRLARSADPAGTQDQSGNGRINFARAAADTGTAFIQPAGSAPVGSGGPFVGPYVAAATSLTLTPSTGISGISVIVNSGGGAFDNNAVNIGIYWDGTLNTTSGTLVDTCVANNGGNIQNNGNCAFNVPPSSLGSHTVVATQQSNPSKSVSTTFIVKANTSTALSSSLNPSASGQSVTFTATVSVVPPPSGTPTGSVTFKDSATNIAGCVNVALASSQATCTTSSLGIGSHSITAVYGGDTTFNGSTSPVVNQVVIIANAVPVAASQSVTTDEDTAKIVTLSATDADGNALAFSIVGNPAHGSLSAITGTACSGIPSSCTASVTYTPAADYNGPDSFTFKVNDGTADSNAATLSITVNAVNDPPTFDAIADQTVNEDAGTQNVSITGVSAGPGNESSQTVTMTAVSSNPAIVPHPTITGTGATRTLAYTPAPNASGQVTITVTADDGQAANNTFSRTFKITVTAVNDAPVAVDDAYNTNEDTPLVIGAPGVLGNDSDVDSPTVTAVLVSGPSHAASFTFNAHGSFNYTPVANYNGPDSFTYKVNDGSVDGNVATVNITVNAVNDAPIATNDVYNTDEDTPLSVAAPGVLGNDNDVDTPTLNAVLVSGPSHAASFTLTPDGSFSYAPVANYNGPDSFKYKANDGTLDSNVAMVTISVLAVNDVTVAMNDAYSTDEDTGLVVPAATGVLANDFDPDTGETLTAVLVDPPQHASGFTLNPDGSFSYTPAADFNGSDTFTYKVNDQGQFSNVAMVNITINPVNDAPVAAAQSVVTNEDAPLTITLSASDVDSANLNFMIGPSGVAHGSLSAIGAVTCVPSGAGSTCTATVTYTPAANYNGPDSFQFAVHDGELQSASATVSITVNAVNDPPVADPGSARTNEDTSVTITLTASDIDSTSLNFMVGPSGASHGTLSAVSNIACTPSGAGATCSATVVYTPAADYNGPDSFVFAVRDGEAQSAPATVSITVTPVNDAPIATGKTVTTPEDTPLPITLNASDIDSGSLGFTIVTPPAHGTLGAIGPSSCTAVPNGTGTPGSTCAPSVTYTPVPDYSGSDSFTFKANDGSLGSGVATISITITPVNDAPVATGATASTNEDTAFTITLSASDIDSPSLTFMIKPPGALHGTLSAIGAPICAPSGGGSTCTASVTYTPALNYNGPDSFQFAVRDGDLQSAPATVSLTVSPVNDAPTAASQNVTTPEDTAVAITLSGNDVDSTALGFTIVSGPSHGTLIPVAAVSCVVEPNGTGTPGATCTRNYTYTPAQDYNGPDSFTFKVNDSSLDSVVATVNISVTPVNDAPSGLNVSVSPTAINEAGSVTLTGSFTDPDIGDTHAVTITWGDGSSQTVNLGAGVFAFSVAHTYADDNPTGTPSDSYTIGVTVADQAGASAGATASVIVNNVAPAFATLAGPTDPIALGDTATLTASFTDVGSADSHKCTFKWDDLTPDTVVDAAGTGNGSCSASHTYAAAGVYEVGVTVQDDDGAAVYSSFQYVVVYDAKGGFVTGGGWINSPAGAYVQNPSLVGKANFGFVSKYLKGANVPTGDTEFQFHAAGFNFKSTVYEWLVIAGAKAQYKGSGTVNGAGNYGFMLTAIDGSVGGGGGIDKFRLKIWNSSGVVYDNQVGSVDTSDVADPTTALGGGSIVIHK